MVLCLVFIGRKSKSQVPSVSRSLESLEKENDDSKVSEQAHCIFRGRGGEGRGGDRMVGSQAQDQYSVSSIFATCFSF